MAATRSSGPEECYIGVDVGTGSVRVGLVTADGRLMEPQKEGRYYTQYD